MASLPPVHETPREGPPVDPTPAAWPQRISLSGRYVTLSPLDPALHAASLFHASSGPGTAPLWTYLFDEPFTGLDSFTLSLAEKAAAADRVFYAILDHATGDAIGFAGYLAIQPNHRSIEVGNILYTPRLQRTPAATEAMFLMARYAIEDLRYRRYEWKCNALNAPSRRAALRYGFTHEGVFRRHMIVKGRNRDTAWYSMLDSEWPARKAAFEQWLDPSNFDSAGRQLQSLSALNGLPG